MAIVPGIIGSSDGRQPNAPLSASASGGDSAATVNFTAPSYLGKPSDNNLYTVLSSPGGVTATGTSSPISVSGLSNGTSYTFTVTLSTRTSANTTIGQSLPSAQTNAVTPVYYNPYYNPYYNVVYYNPVYYNPYYNVVYYNPVYYNVVYYNPVYYNAVYYNPVYYGGPIKGLYGVRCISEDTYVRLGTGTGTEYINPDTGKKVLLDSEGKIVAKQAKDIEIGDVVLSAVYDEIDPDYPDYEVFSWNSDTLTFDGHTSTTIVDIDESQKTQLLYFNGDTSAQFTAEHPILTKLTDADGKEKWQFAMISEINEGDTVLKYNPETDLYEEVIVETIDVMFERKSVYIFSAEPQDLIIAGDIVTHNK